MKLSLTIHSSFMLCIWLFIGTTAQAQDWYGWVMPRESQAASVSQKVGVTDINVVYHRPNVKERKIWGGIVPYGKVWRAGANNSTTINFSTSVFIEGKELKAGTYSYFLIPTEDQWTVIFNKNAAQWGAYTYSEDQDALRVEVKPVQSDFTESLNFNFPTINDSTTILTMNWEKIELPVTISVNLRKAVDDKVKSVFSSEAALFAMYYYHDVLQDFDEALKWANASLALKENQAALTMKAQVYTKKGNYKDALELATKALEVRKRDMPNMSTKSLDDLINELKQKAK